MDERQFSLDGDKFSASMLREYHVRQPGAPEHFDRSTLLIGARGVGKTFLLRHRKSTTHPEAHYINLQSTLNSLTEEGIGSGAVDLPEVTSARVAAKSSALIVAAVLQSLEQDGANKAVPPEALLRRLLPRDQSQAEPRMSPAAFKRVAIRTDLADWPTAPSRAFLEALDYIHSRQPMSLFLDRADDIPEPAARIALKLLDQSVPFRTVVATRPGALQLVPHEQRSGTTPGDHYELLHIGYDPRDQQWTEFFINCIARTLEKTKRSVPRGMDLTWITRMARESTRNGITYAEVAGRRANPDDRLRWMAEKRHDKIRTITFTLWEHSAELHSVVNDLSRRSVQGREGTGFHSTLIELSNMSGARAVDRTNPLDRFLLDALRVEFLYLPSGVSWHPPMLERSYEVLPILAWDGKDVSWLR